MTRSKTWWAPLTGVAFIVLVIAGFAVMGEPKDAQSPTKEIVDYYVDNKDAVRIGGLLTVAAGVLLIFFGAQLRQVLHAAGGEGEVLSLVAFVGTAIVATAAAIDGTIMFSLAEAADDIDPVAVQALQALWDNDFLPFMLGILCFLWATGLAVIRTGVLPKWLGWVMILFGVVGFTPVGFASGIVAAILVLVLSVILTLRARRQEVPAA
jgi:hypothetical protein